MVRRTCAIGSVVLLLTAGGSFAQTPPQEQKPFRVGSGIRPPAKIKHVNPVYPAEAQKARVSGVVVVEATIDPEGKVKSALVLRSIPLLDAAAIDAVKQWEFTPTIVYGKAVPVIMTVTVNFTLGAPSGPGLPPNAGNPLISQRSPDISALAKRAAEALQKHRSVQYVVASTLELTGEGLTAKATYGTTMSLLNPGKSRIETKAPMGLRFLTVSDGEFTWVYNGMAKRYTKQAAAQGLTALLADMENRDVARMLGPFGANVKTTTLPDDTVMVDGQVRPCSVVETRVEKLDLPMAQGAGISDLAMVNCIDKDLGLGLKSTISMKVQIPSVGEPIQIQLASVATTLKIDEPLADALFVFTPPPGAREGPSAAPFGGSTVDLTGRDAPAFDVRALDGTPHSLASLKGKHVLLDFWATWCGPCRRAMPAMENIARDYKDQGLVVLGIDVGENRETVEDFLNTTPVS